MDFHLISRVIRNFLSDKIHQEIIGRQVKIKMQTLNIPTVYKEKTQTDIILKLISISKEKKRKEKKSIKT